MNPMLVYCADPSHTADPLGPIITGPDPALPDDVYIWGEFYRVAPGDAHWQRRYTPIRDVDGQIRELLLDDGTVLPPKARQTSLQQNAELFGETREKWEPKCRRCGQRGGR